MSERTKSNLIAWIWVVVAFFLAAVAFLAQPWEYPIFGDIHRKFWFSQFWFFALSAGFLGLFLLMIRLAKSYDEDASPAAPTVRITSAENRRIWLSAAFWIAAFVVPLWPSLWNDISGLPENPETLRAFLRVSIGLQIVAVLLTPRTRKEPVPRGPFGSLADRKTAITLILVLAVAVWFFGLIAAVRLNSR